MSFTEMAYGTPTNRVLKKITLLTYMVLVSICLFKPAYGAGNFTTDFNGASENERSDFGFVYAVSSHLFPNVTAIDNDGNPFPNGVPKTGSGTIWHIHDRGLGTSPKSRWYQNWDRGKADTHFTDTSGLALTLGFNGSTVYANHGLDSASGGPGAAGTAVPFYESGGNSSISYSMVNNFDFISAGYFRTGSNDLEIDSISGYFASPSSGSFDFDPLSTDIHYHFNIYSAAAAGSELTSGGRAGEAGVPGADQFFGDILTSVSGQTTYASGTMLSSPDFYTAADGYKIHKATYLLDEPITLDKDTNYFFAPYVAIVPEPNILISVCLALVWILALHRPRLHENNDHQIGYQGNQHHHSTSRTSRQGAGFSKIFKR